MQFVINLSLLGTGKLDQSSQVGVFGKVNQEFFCPRYHLRILFLVDQFLKNFPFPHQPFCLTLLFLFALNQRQQFLHRRVWGVGALERLQQGLGVRQSPCGQERSGLCQLCLPLLLGLLAARGVEQSLDLTFLGKALLQIGNQVNALVVAALRQKISSGGQNLQLVLLCLIGAHGRDKPCNFVILGVLPLKFGQQRDGFVIVASGQQIPSLRQGV